MVVGSSVGALNGAYYAGDPTLKGVLQLETIWRGLQRHDVFPVTWRTLLGFLWRRDFLISHDGIRKLIDDQSPIAICRMPSCRCISSRPISSPATAWCCRKARPREAIVASTAIPGAFAPIRYKDYYLADGAISSNTPIRVAVAKGAQAPDHPADRATPARRRRRRSARSPMRCMR